ncbi:MAG: flippase [Nitrospirae bacterium]|nr:flippase [Nitrospirota bacterium]
MSDTVKSSLRRAIKGSTLVFIGSILSILIWFVTRLIIVRNLTKEEFGVYSILIAIGGLVSAVALLGIHEAVPRYISICFGKDDKKRAAFISGFALKSGLLSGIIAAFGLIIFSDLISKHIFYKPDIASFLVIISLFVFSSVMANIFIGILRGYNIIYPKVLLLDIGQPLVFLVFLLSFVFLKFSLLNIVWAFTGAMILAALLIGIYYFRRVHQTVVDADINTETGRDFIKFAVNLLILNMLGIIMLWGDTLILGRYEPAEEVGIYNVSMSLAKLLLFPINAMEFAFLPIAGELYSRNEHKDLNRTYQVLTKWLFSATFPIFFVLFFFPEMTVSFLFGTNYADSALSLRILSAGFLFSAMMGTTGVLMLVIGKPGMLMKVSAAAAALNIILNYILIKHFGMGSAGAAVATIISYIASNLVVLLLLYRTSRTHPFTIQYIKPIIAAVLVGVVVYLVAKSLPLYFWMMPFYLTAYISGYFAALLYTGSFERDDIEIFDAVLKKTGLELKTLRRVVYNSVRT